MLHLLPNYMHFRPVNQRLHVADIQCLIYRCVVAVYLRVYAFEEPNRVRLGRVRQVRNKAAQLVTYEHRRHHQLVFTLVHQVLQ